MENFSLTGASGWQTLSSLLILDSTFKLKYKWSMMMIRNTSANTMIIKSLPGGTAPASDSGINLTATTGIAPGVAIDAGNQGVIDGAAVWIKCSGASTTFDLTIIRKTGLGE